MARRRRSPWPKEEAPINERDDAVAVVLAWHAALNGGDADRLAALSDADVEVGGPRGVGRGVGLLREWVERAGIRLEPSRVFRRGGVVVVAQRASWAGAPSEPSAVASVFSVEDGRVRSIVRHDDLATALAAAGLDEGDEAARPG